MSGISPISSATTSRIDQTRGTQASSTLHIPQQANFESEKFHFPEIELEEHRNSALNPDERPMYRLLIELFIHILINKIDVVAANPRDHGTFAVEASFLSAVGKDAHHQMLLPLRGVDRGDRLIAPYNGVMSASLEREITYFVERVFLGSSDADISKLVVVTAHEFGHFLSYQRGNHDVELRTGLYMFSRKMIHSGFEYLWQVFREECIAWRLGLEVISKYGYDQENIYKQVKDSSLKTYFANLNLVNAPVSVYYKLSLLGEDFFNNNLSERKAASAAPSVAAVAVGA